MLEVWKSNLIMHQGYDTGEHRYSLCWTPLSELNKSLRGAWNEKQEPYGSKSRRPAAELQTQWVLLPRSSAVPGTPPFPPFPGWLFLRSPGVLCGVVLPGKWFQWSASCKVWSCLIWLPFHSPQKSTFHKIYIRLLYLNIFINRTGVYFRVFLCNYDLQYFLITY